MTQQLASAMRRILFTEKLAESTWLALLAWGSPLNGAVPDKPPYSLDVIKSHWRSRQDKVNSLKIEWRTERVFRNSRQSADMWHGDPNSPDGFSTIEYQCRVLIDGSMIEYNCECPDAARHNEPPIIRETYNGKRSELFSINPDDTKAGALTTKGYGYTGQSLPLFPIYWAFRPLHTEMGAFRLESAVILSEPGIIDD